MAKAKSLGKFLGTGRGKLISLLIVTVAVGTIGTVMLTRSQAATGWYTVRNSSYSGYSVTVSAGEGSPNHYVKPGIARSFNSYECGCNEIKRFYVHPDMDMKVSGDWGTNVYKETGWHEFPAGFRENYQTATMYEYRQ